jgi:hypothetical protein
MWPGAETVHECHKSRRVDPSADSSSHSAPRPPELPGDELRSGGDVRRELDGHRGAIGAAPVGSLIEGGLIECDDHVGAECANRLFARKAWLGEVEPLRNVMHGEPTLHVAAHEIVHERAGPIQGLDFGFAREEYDERSAWERGAAEWRGGLERRDLAPWIVDVGAVVDEEGALFHLDEGISSLECDPGAQERGALHHAVARLRGVRERTEAPSLGVYAIAGSREKSARLGGHAANVVRSAHELSSHTLTRQLIDHPTLGDREQGFVVARRYRALRGNGLVASGRVAHT